MVLWGGLKGMAYLFSHDEEVDRYNLLVNLLQTPGSC